MSTSLRKQLSGRGWRSRWQAAKPWLKRIALVLLLVPPLLLAIYRFVPPPGTPLMLKRLVQGYGLDKDWVPLEQIAPALPRSVIASEDNLFCEHWGFDWKALSKEIEDALDGERPRGASTITMQTAKNLFLWDSRSPLRKVFEAWLTPQVELILGKRRIMEIYLNIVEFGPGVYGAEAAARRYFGKPAASLSLREASLLAAVLPSPLSWSVAEPGPYVRQRAATIERRIGQIRPLLACAW